MTPDPSTGQILPGSKFGDKLTELAREAKVIVEIGTWKGGGSTMCLALGLMEANQWLITVEADPRFYTIAREAWSGRWSVWTVCGSIIRPDEFPPYFHPLEDRRSQYAEDKALCTTAYCLPIIPPAIDLLLLDGGEWTSHMEYRKLKDRCKVIALDDSTPTKSIKSYAAREDMLANGWTVLADEPDDRNGWFIGRRP